MLRSIVIVLYASACAGVIALVVAAVGWYLFATGFAYQDGFVGLSGAAARGRLERAWPAAVDAASVWSVSYKTESSRDSYSDWYRIEMTQDAAVKWMDGLRPEQGRNSNAGLKRLDTGLEGVHWGPPPIRRDCGDAPVWWKPPGIDFRTTWKRGPARFAGATYYAFDETARTLWIYDYCCQY
jgi:hypothetical protein